MIHLFKTGFWFLILFACISLINGFKRIIPDTETTQEIKLKVHHRRACGKSSLENAFPENLDVEIPVISDLVTLSLRKNDRITHYMPVTVERNGKIIYHKLPKSQVGVFNKGNFKGLVYPDGGFGYYFDTKSDSAFMVQYGDKDGDLDSNFEFFGSFLSGGKRFLVQAPDSNRITHTLTDISLMMNGSANDAIFPENEIHSNHFSKQNDEAPKIRKRREIRATQYEIELLMVFDYAAYSKFLKRAKGTTLIEKDTNAKSDLTKYAALLLGAIDQRFRSITGQGYEIHLVPAGLHIADTEETSWWSEVGKNVSVHPNRVYGYQVLTHFSAWVNSYRKSIPGNDHAMLFTGYIYLSFLDARFRFELRCWVRRTWQTATELNRPCSSTTSHPTTDILQVLLSYDMHHQGNPSQTGMAYVGKLCDSAKKVSVLESILVGDTASLAAHELGHSLGARHDGEGITCPPDGRYVMHQTPVAQVDAAKNLRLWGFSNCSLDYFNSFISELNRNNTNCMTKRSATYDARRFDKYSNELLGQIYPPDIQCKSQYGSKSLLCREFAYNEICSRMLCKHPSNGTRCWARIALEGTTCGDRKICKKGHCVTSDKASAIDSEYCMFGEQPSYNKVYSTDKTCQDWFETKDNHYRCYYYHHQCCKTCAKVALSYNHLNGCTYGDRTNACKKLPGYGCYKYSKHCCSTCSKYETGIKGCEYGDRHPDCKPYLCRLYDVKTITTVCCSSCAELRKKLIK